MNYTRHTTTLNRGNNEYKEVRLQEYSDGYHKATNKYYLNGKLVTKQERFSCERIIDEASRSSLKTISENWIR